MLAALFSATSVVWALMLIRARCHRADAPMSPAETQSRHLIPVVLLIGAVLGSIYAGIATATEAAAAVGWSGAAAHPALQGAVLGGVPRLADGRHAAVLHDRADPGWRGVPDAVDGLHRPAAPPGRVDRRRWASPSSADPDARTDGVLHRARLLPRRHLDGGADDGRDHADDPERPASTRSGSGSSSSSSSKWRRSRRRWASTCSCCRA